MTSEVELAAPAIKLLAKAPQGMMSTRELREALKKRLPLSSDDTAPLLNRSDMKIDQRVRNLKSHRKSPGNIIHEGYVEPIPGGFRITNRGRILSKKLK